MLTFERPFGVEIECIVGSYDYERLQESFPAWDCGYDADNEIRSPILVGEAGFQSLKSMCDSLRGIADVDQGCGLHVHHDATDLTKSDLIRLVKSWTENQPFISSLLNEDRHNNGACVPWTKGMFEDWLRYVERYETLESGRYALNLSALSEHGTVEIRQHHATVEYDEIAAWVKFGQAFIGSVKRRRKAIDSSKDTPYLLGRIRMPDTEKKFYEEKLLLQGVMKEKRELLRTLLSGEYRWRSIRILCRESGLTDSEARRQLRILGARRSYNNPDLFGLNSRVGY